MIPFEGSLEELAPSKPWFSPTRLRTFQECPKRYEFQFVLKRPTRPAPNLDLGSNVHAALRDWYRLPRAQRTFDRLLDLYRDAWRANRPAFQHRSRDELKEWGERGKAMLRRFVERTPADLEPLATEKPVRVDFGTVVVGGRVDRVDRIPDGLRVVDYKTGRYPDDIGKAREEDLAAPIYARGTSEAYVGEPVLEVEYLYLDGMKSVRFHVEPDWLDARERVVRDQAFAAADAERQKSFPERPSRRCRYCDFLELCPKGRAFLRTGVVEEPLPAPAPGTSRA